MREYSSFAQSSRYCLANVRSWFVNQRDRLRDPQAAAFFDRLTAGGFDPNAHIDVVERYGLIYLAVPKCASTTVKTVLSVLTGAAVTSREHSHRRRASGLKSPRLVGVSAFHRIATSPASLRFSFVRNPYARLVSAWADKYRAKPLVPGDSFVDQYLAYRTEIDARLPRVSAATLSFPDFVEFASATAEHRLNAHWHLQDNLLGVPGIELDMVGKVETFHDDFSRVLNRLGLDGKLLAIVDSRLNATRHGPWPDYYTAALAARVYRAYERDFDRFGYARAPNAASAV